jgi:phytoene synthase
LAQTGLDRITQARATRKTLPKEAAPALLAGWQAERMLQMVVRDPKAVADGRLAPSEFQRRGGLLWQAFSGRW